MKHFLSKLGVAVGTFALSASLALPAAALSPRGGDSYVLPQQETVTDDLYAAGGTVLLNGVVDGDALIAAGTLVANGAITHDLMAVGGTIAISGDVGDDVRVAGGNVSLMSSVAGDALLAGGNVVLGSDAVIGRDLVVAAGTLVLDGHVMRHARLTGGTVLVNGRVDGDIEIRAQEVRFGANARLANKVRVLSPKPPIVEPGAELVDGTEHVVVATKRTRPDIRTEKFARMFAGFAAMAFMLELVALMTAAIVMVSVFNAYSGKVVDQALGKPGKALLSGFGVAILTPVAAFLLMLTVIGSWLGILLGAGYAFLIVLAKIYGGVVFGAWLWRLGSKGKARGIDWKSAASGVFLLAFIGLVPIVGWIILLLAFLAALGGLYAVALERMKQMR